MPCQVCVVPVGSFWAVMSQAPPPGSASSMARWSGILGSRKIKAAGTVFFLPHINTVSSHAIMKRKVQDRA